MKNLLSCDCNDPFGEVDGFYSIETFTHVIDTESYKDRPWNTNPSEKSEAFYLP
jgi:hypothetical protein